MMKVLLQAGYDIEFHIVVLTDIRGSPRVSQSLGLDFLNLLISGSELSPKDVQRYASLAAATGGSCLVVPQDHFDERSAGVKSFLDQLKASGDASAKGKAGRLDRRRKYKLEASKGKTERFEWLPALPSSSSQSS